MTIEQSISVTHNVEMAHRLYLTGGKCAQIHGHSWSVKLTLFGEVDSHGLLNGINFTDLKRHFRHFLDTTYDHRILLNSEDPLAGKLHIKDTVGPGSVIELPGLATLPDDPTTENFAKAIGNWTLDEMTDSGDPTVVNFTRIAVYVKETQVNHSEWIWAP